MSSPEQQPTTPENNVEAPKNAADLYEALDDKLKNNAERDNKTPESGEKQAEKARVEAAEALEAAANAEKTDAEKAHRAKQSPAPRRRGGISKKDKKASFERTIKHVQAELPAPERAFSKLIHTPVIEKTSEVVGSTIARPNAILAGAVVAFFAVLAVYLLAKNLGYVLSGFETIAAFIVGWVIGVVYDYFRVLATGKK